jgi:hypothetical protein
MTTDRAMMLQAEDQKSTTVALSLLWPLVGFMGSASIMVAGIVWLALL